MTGASARLKARVAGLLYVLVAVVGGGGLVLGSRFVVRGDAAATAANILANEPLYRLSSVADLVGALLYVGVTAILYELLRPVSRTVSLTAAFFSLVGCATGAAISVFYFGPLLLLKGAPYLAGFSADQLQALALTAIRLQATGSNLHMVFFGVYCVLIGWLFLRSGFFPPLVGLLMSIGGLCWLVSALANLLSPPLAGVLYPWILIPGFVGEMAVAFWLLLVGLDEAKWRARADAA